MPLSLIGNSDFLGWSILSSRSRSIWMQFDVNCQVVEIWIDISFQLGACYYLIQMQKNSFSDEIPCFKPLQLGHRRAFTPVCVQCISFHGYDGVIFQPSFFYFRTLWTSLSRTSSFSTKIFSRVELLGLFMKSTWLLSRRKSWETRP